MDDIPIGVLIPVNIRGDHNEIIGIWVNGNQQYYYQSELTEEGVSEGLYYSEGLKVDDEDVGELYDELEESIIQISLN
jgi:hypothetical protein